MGPGICPLPSLKGSEAWAPAWHGAFYDGAILGLQGLGIRGPYWGTIGSTLEVAWCLCVLGAAYDGHAERTMQESN